MDQGVSRAYAQEWDQWARLKYLTKAELPAAKKEERSAKPVDPNEIRVQETGEVVAYDIPVVLDKPAHQPHLENFFDAARGQAKLNCPADVAFRSEVVVHKINEAVEAKKTLVFAPEDFAV